MRTTLTVGVVALVALLALSRLAAGLVTARPRPPTAKGTVFLLLEDEHGSANVIVPVPVDARDREHVRHGAFVLVDGRAERNGPQVNVIARRVAGFGPEVLRGSDEGTATPEPALAHRSHDFR